MFLVIYLFYEVGAHVLLCRLGLSVRICPKQYDRERLSRSLVLLCLIDGLTLSHNERKSCLSSHLALRRRWPWSRLPGHGPLWRPEPVPVWGTTARSGRPPSPWPRRWPRSDLQPEKGHVIRSEVGDISTNMSKESANVRKTHEWRSQYFKDYCILRTILYFLNRWLRQIVIMECKRHSDWLRI